MTYTKAGSFTNGSYSPAPISAAFLNNLESAVVDATRYLAPAPTGLDQTTDLNALAQLAQSTNGTVVLQNGTYIGNIETLSGERAQARIVGQGRWQTTLQAATNAKPNITLRGVSGALAGGGVQSLTLLPANGGGGTALKYSGTCGAESTDVHITSDGTHFFNEGVTFHNENGTDWTEFDTFNGSIDGCVLPVYYKVSNGVESFHGSGLTGNTVIGTTSTSTGPVIRLDPSAFPYDSPLSATVFFNSSSSAQTLITSSSTSRRAWWYGDVRTEFQGAPSLTLATSPGPEMYLLGTFGGLSTGNSRLGKLFLADKATYDAGTFLVQAKPRQHVTTLVSGTTAITSGVTLQNAGMFLNVTIDGPNYRRTYLLYAMDNGGSAGTVQQIAAPFTYDPAAVGAPTFAWTNYALQVTGASYTSAYTAYVGVFDLFGGVQANMLPQ